MTRAKRLSELLHHRGRSISRLGASAVRNQAPDGSRPRCSSRTFAPIDPAPQAHGAPCCATC
jgi:hypothetical protein